VLARHVPADAALTLAYSGGLDSGVLLHALAALRGSHPLRLDALHIHHGLSPHADAWARFCADRCAALGVPLRIVRVQLAPRDPAGVEAAARRARRLAFAACDADFLATAHHLDDQAETLLLQALRGAGPKGLAGMAECQRPRGWQAAQLRPLLGLSRTLLLAAAREQSLEWVEDESNADLRYRRNVLRHAVLPTLASHFPGSPATLARAAAHQAEAAALLDELAAIDAAQALAATSAGWRLDCVVLASLSEARGRNLLRHFIARHDVALPPARRLDEALRQATRGRPDARVCVDLGAAQLWVWRGGAYVVRSFTPPPPVAWRGEGALNLPGVGCLTLTPATAEGLRQSALEAGLLVLGCRRGGERMRPQAGGATRSLKTLLQEQAMPPWLRARVPVLRCGDAIVWVGGVGCDADWLAGTGETGLRITWCAAP